MPLYSWMRDKEEILERIRIDAALKLCVKLLDEPSLIEGWIRHHARIVGFENLIIADNGSTDERTLEVYKKFGDLVTIFQFDGPHNEIHWHPRFGRLFSVIRETSRRFAFVDVDERLVHIDGSEWTADDSIVARIANIPPGAIIPTTWLINALDEFDVFSLLDTEGRPQIVNNLRWGKPILPPELVGSQPGIHNIQFDRHSFTTELGTSLFLLHYTQFPNRRLAVNINKLVSRGVIPRGASAQDVAGMSFDEHDDKSIMRFVHEIKDMLSLLQGRSDREGGLPNDHLRLELNGSIHYSTWGAEQEMSKFASAGPALIDELFNGGAVSHVPSDQALLLKQALDLRQRGRGTSAEVLFRRGMALYPTVLDRYGGPAFRKELMRTYLYRQEWAKASNLLPVEGDPGGASWHHILYARALTQAGNRSAALRWWRLVLAADPENHEARDALQ